MLTSKALRSLLLVVVALYGIFILFVYFGGVGFLRLHTSPSLNHQASSTLPIGVRLQRSRISTPQYTTQPIIFKKIEGMYDANTRKGTNDAKVIE
jgi:hypothetical protein